MPKAASPAAVNSNLADMFWDHTENVSDKWEQFFSIYQAELGSLVHSGAPIRLLEIGIQNGGLLQIWAKYLPAGSKIFGFDIDPKCATLRLGPNIDIYVGDASNPAVLEDRLGDLTFEVIIDDGSHRSSNVIATFRSCFPRLKPGGLYFIEDLHCSYSAHHEGGLRSSDSSMEYLKSLADALHADHFDAADLARLSPSQRAANDAMAREIGRITFYDSVGVIARLPATKSRPFARMLTGSLAPVSNPGPHLVHLPLQQLRHLALSPSADPVFGPSLRAGLVSMREELEARATEVQSALQQSRSEFETKLAEARAMERRLQDELAAMRQNTVELLDRAKRSEDTAAALLDRAKRSEASAEYAEQLRASVSSELAILRGARSVRVALFMAHRFARLPRPMRRAIRGALVTALWLRAKVRGRPMPLQDALRQITAANYPPPVISPQSATGPLPVAELVARHFPSLEPYPCFPVAASAPRLSIVTDSIGPSSLFGGVGTSLMIGAQLANRLGATLRIVTRTEEAMAAPVHDVLRNAGLRLNGTLELAFAPLDGTRDLPLAPNDVFLTTSWWTTRATLGAVAPARIIALVQEDERMFYPRGDERLRCAETLDHPGLVSVVNTEGLLRHLAAGPDRLANLGSKAMCFEPAFPTGATAASHLPARAGVRRLFFYARPHNLRNLFWRGIEPLDDAAAQGLFPPDRWEVHWVGRGLPEVKLSGRVVPIIHDPMGWTEYKSFIETMDAGFVLMDTPHPSYPPLDLASAGAAVLTTAHPGKASLTHYTNGHKE